MPRDGPENPENPLRAHQAVPSVQWNSAKWDGVGTTVGFILLLRPPVRPPSSASLGCSPSGRGRDWLPAKMGLKRFGEIENVEKF